MLAAQSQSITWFFYQFTCSHNVSAINRTSHVGLLFHMLKDFFSWNNFFDSLTYLLKDSGTWCKWQVICSHLQMCAEYIDLQSLPKLPSAEDVNVHVLILTIMKHKCHKCVRFLSDRLICCNCKDQFNVTVINLSGNCNHVFISWANLVINIGGWPASSNQMFADWN